MLRELRWSSFVFVERFMAWSVAVGSDQRAAAISQLVKKISQNQIIEQDRADSEQVLVLYLDDPSVKVRQSLARAVCEHNHASRTVIYSLMQDVSEVAAEIYGHFPNLHEKQLLEAIRQNDKLICQAIASRNSLSGPVVRELVQSCDESAITVLLDNEMVMLSPHLKHDVAVRLGDRPNVRERLLAHDDLLSSTRQLLVKQLSSSLLDLSSKMGWADETRMKIVAQDATNRVAIDISMNTNLDDIGAYVEHLRDTHQLTTALLVRACCLGNAALFESALSLLSGLSLKRVQSIVDEGRISAFRSLYAKTGLPDSAYQLFVASIKAWQTPGDAADIVMDILDRVDSDPSVDGELLALLGRISVELNKPKAKVYERQLLLAA